MTPFTAPFSTASLRRLALAGLACTAALVPARAATFNWKGGGADNYWSTTANWVENAIPPSDLLNTDLIFGSIAAIFPSITPAYSIRSLTFSTGASGYAFDSGPLTLGTGGITENAAAAQGFSAPVFLGAAQTWTLGSGAGALSFGGGVNTTGGPGKVAHALTINALSTAGGGNIIDGNFSGGGSVTKTGAGTLTLSGANTFSGGVTLATGTLAAGHDAALGTGALGVSVDATLFAAGANRTLGNAIALSSGATLSLANDPAGARGLTLNGAITGAGGLTVQVPGATVSLGGSQVANTFTGLTSVTGGTLRLNKDSGIRALGGGLSIGNATSPGAPGSAVVQLGNNAQTGNATAVSLYADGLFDLGGRPTVIGTLTMSGGEVRIGNGGLNLAGDVNINATANGSLITSTALATSLYLGTTRTFTVADGAAAYDLDLRANVGSGTLAKAGAGTLRLTGSFNASLAVVLQAGTLAVASNDALGSTGQAFTLAGGTVVADLGDHSLLNPVDVTGNATVGSIVDGTPRALSFTGAASLAAGATLTVSNNAATSFTGVVSGAGGIAKTGNGTLTLSNAANTFSGGVTLNGGTLAIAGEGSLGGGASALTFNAGRLLFMANATTARTFTLSNAATLAPAAGTTLTYGSGAVVNGGFLGVGGTHAFAGGSALNGSITALGSTVTTAGAVALTNATVRGAVTVATGSTVAATGAVLSSAGTLAVSGTVNSTGFEIGGVLRVESGGVISNTGSALVLGGGSRTTVAAGGSLRTAAGAGTTIELNGGLLVVNGSLNGTVGAVTYGTTNVNYGGTLKGAGSFGAVAVSDGGRISPGNSPGAASVSALTFAPGGRYDFELNSAHAAPGIGADFLAVTGTLDLAAGTTPNSRFTVGLFTLDGSTSPAALTDFDPSQPYRFLLATAAAITGFSAGEFAVDTSGFLNGTAGGAFAIAQEANPGGGSDLVVRWTPVPEPNAAALLLAGAALGLARRRR